MTVGYLLHLIVQTHQLLMILPVMVALEVFWPRGRPGQRQKGLALLSVYTVITAAVFAATDEGMTLFGVRALWHIPTERLPAWATFPLALASSILVLLLGDFLYYWFHRAQHALPLLWRFHVVHHAVRDLNAANTYPHWTEEIVRLPFVTIPVALLVPAGGGWVTWVGLFGVAQAYFIHSATRVHYGPLSAVLCDNRFHRLHHSVQPEHFDKNFGVITPLWDCLFGTAVWPKPGEWPDVGVDDYPEVDGVIDYLMRPFSRRRRQPVTANHPPD